MSLVTAYNIYLNFLEKEIFSNVGFQIEPGDRIGLVGPNGSGKTTLLRLVRGEVSPDSGEIRKKKGVRMGYLPQDIYGSLSGLLLDSVIDSVPNRTALAARLKKLEDALKKAKNEKEQAEIAEELAEIHRLINNIEIQFPAHEAEKILIGLGFKSADFKDPISSLSGGWKMRAALASLLYQKPDLLLLDEPTNHLDIPSIRWFEQFLKEFGGAMLIVSHDRDFLNRQSSRIISLEPEGMRFYSGNYDFYLKSREEERRALEAMAKKQEQRVKEAERFIERFRAKATKARQAQSKIKLVKKLEMVETHKKEKTIRFSFPEAPRSGRDVVAIQNISKAFGEKHLYHNLDLTVLRGERIAVIGPNGAGKTTLLRIIAGETAPDKGRVSLGHGTIMGYFAQHHSEMLNPSNTVLQEVYNVVPHESIGFVRGICSAFLFSGNEVDKVVGTLSGGEKARVALAKLLVKPGNLMVMDEPTNHLDISSSERLIDALNDYSGTLLFVSHNQSFINRLATKIWDINAGEVYQYPGNLDEYYDHLARAENLRMKERRKGMSGSLKAATDRAPVNSDASRRKNLKAEKRERAERRKHIYDTLKPIKAELGKVENSVTQLESRQRELELTLADPQLFKNEEKSVPLLAEYKRVKEELEYLLSRWEEINNELEKTERELGIQTGD